MKVSIVGAGAMGTLLGHGLVRGGHAVTMIDLGARVAQIQSNGLVLTDKHGRTSSVRPALVTAEYATAGTQDVVILATKSQDLPTVAAGVMRLARSDTIIVTIQNGIPWWYLYGLPLDIDVRRLDCLDPDGVLERTIPLSHVIGCVAYPAAILEADGRVRHVEGVRFPVGELDNTITDRAGRLSALLESGGFKSRVIGDIRSEIWLKAWGALSINPVSALTRATMVDICTYPPARDLISRMMEEARQVAETYGATFRHTIEKRIDGAQAVGAHKTSMLQDVEAGRPVELDGIITSVIELANLAGIEVPRISSIYSCIALVNEALQVPPQRRIASAS